jgi:hypothetical protein
MYALIAPIIWCLLNNRRPKGGFMNQARVDIFRVTISDDRLLKNFRYQTAVDSDSREELMISGEKNIEQEIGIVPAAVEVLGISVDSSQFLTCTMYVAWSDDQLDTVRQSTEKIIRAITVAVWSYMQKFSSVSLAKSRFTTERIQVR